MIYNSNMLNYDDRLRINREQQGLPQEPWREEWDILKNTDKYKYDPIKDYLYEREVLKRTINLFKKLDYPDPEASARSIFLTPSDKIDKHYLGYVYWMDYQRDDFKKDFNPTSYQGLNYLWVAWNFKSDAPMEEVKTQMERIVNHSMFAKCKLTYAFEYYTDTGSHPHVHMLIEMKRTGTINPADIKYTIFTQALKKIHKVEAFDYKYSWAVGKYIQKRCGSKDVYLAYLSGNKKEKKEENCLKDKLWRELNNLENLYIKDRE